MRSYITLVSAVALTQPASPVVLIFNTSDHCKLSKTSPCQILRSTASAGGIRRDTATVGDSPVFQPLRTDQYLSAAIAAAPPETVAVFSLICPLHNCQFSVSHSDQIHFFCHAIPSFLLASTGNRQPLQPAPQRGQQKPPVDTVPASFPFSVPRLTALFPPHRARGFPEPADGVY